MKATKGIVAALAAAAVLSAGALFAKPAGELKVSADRVAADNVTGALAASGHVQAVSAPVVLHSDYVTRSEDGTIALADPTHLTTCTNDWDHLHWRVTGEMEFLDKKYVLIKNA